MTTAMRVAAVIVLGSSCTTPTTAATCEHQWQAAVATARAQQPASQVVAAARRLYLARLGPARVAQCAQVGG